MDYYFKLIEDCSAVLKGNDFGKYIVPSKELYPHQWLWDSSFSAIGLAHIDVDRAKQEIISIFEGQWTNGMLPHMIFRTDDSANEDKLFWASWRNPKSPDIPTSGITQPPIIAEAIVRIGALLPKTEKLSWYREVLPKLIEYHNWIYTDRDPKKRGLAIIIHPWESGLDNTPPLVEILNQYYRPWWVKLLVGFKVVRILDSFRKDVSHNQSSLRPTTTDLLSLYALKVNIKKYSYNIKKIINKKSFAVEDITFNSLLLRNNEHLVSIAKTIKIKLPKELQENIKKTKDAFGELWDSDTNQFYSRNFYTNNLIIEPSIGSLMPLYSGYSDKGKLDKIVKCLEDQNLYGCNYPIPSVPLNSKWFSETEYWQGPTWVNANWLIIDGLLRNNYIDIAEVLKETTLDMVDNSGIYDYYNPINGHGVGIKDFSWTAALSLDLAKNYKKT